MLTENEIEEIVSTIRLDNKRAARILLNALNTSHVPALKLKISDPPAQEELQAVVDRLNDVIAALNGK